MKTFKFLFLVASASLLVLALTSMQGGQKKAEPWEVPARFKNMKNPELANKASIDIGTRIYRRDCLSCHGRTGLGDGTKARELETFSGDFSSAEFHNQTDGEMFYKTKFGRGEMPAYDKKVPDEDIWNLVNYMRTFKK